MRLKAMKTPGRGWRIATYAGQKTANTVASELRRGKRPVPNGTTHEQWKFQVGAVGKKYGLWATFGESSDEATASA